jgi:hypothetical protein
MCGGGKADIAHDAMRAACVAAIAVLGKPFSRDTRAGLYCGPARAPRLDYNRHVALVF